MNTNNVKEEFDHIKRVTILESEKKGLKEFYKVIRREKLSIKQLNYFIDMFVDVRLNNQMEYILSTIESDN